ncbi:MAG: enoyl-ACP reductase [Candidatus Sumerlaeaceae bacterium]|nr:enoyl-ACP reductase [Candidatus Sumerlaeaceae bacterium]
MSDKPLSGKVGVVFGVANKRSIAWSIAQAWADAGARLILNYQNERLKAGVEELAASLGPDTAVAQCDLSSDDEIKSFFEFVKSKTDRLDLLAHCVAFAPREALDGRYVDTTREAFLLSHNISVYTLVAVARGAAPLFTNGGSMITLSFYGAEKVFPHYNVMGVAKASLEASVRYLAADLGAQKIRVNAISAGPVNTLAARGIAGFTDMLKYYSVRAPLGRSCELSEIGQTALFLGSDGSSGITGQVIYVDGGYQVVGM